MLKYHLWRFLFKIFFFPFLSIKIIAKHHIPSSGPYFVALNHTNVMDTPILLIAFPVVKWRFFVADKWKKHWIFGPISRKLGGIFINRERPTKETIHLAVRAINSKAVFGIAPEGSRSKNGQLQKGKNGIAYLSMHLNTPILPVGIDGADLIRHNICRFKRTTIYIRVGPLIFPNYHSNLTRTRKDLNNYTELIMFSVAALLPENRRGYYADIMSPKGDLQNQ